MAQDESSKRAATLLAIAQLKFKQGLKKEDVEARLPLIAVELSSQYLTDIDAVLKQNSPANVQKCTGWIMKYIAPSKTRIAVLGSYFVSVSKSIAVKQQQQQQQQKTATQSEARSRFLLLLIVNDVLHADKFHQRSADRHGIFGRASVPFLIELVELVAACVHTPKSPEEEKLKALLNYWHVNQLVSSEDAKALQDRAQEAILVAQGGIPVRKRHYLLPEYHGDRNAPWHELPASYMLDPMIRYPDRPIDPSRIKVRRFDGKRAPDHVCKLLDNFFENLDLKHIPTGDNPTGETHKYDLSLDPVGQLVKRDKDTGKTTTVGNGYGWSMKLCQDMQKDGVPEVVKVARESAQRKDETQEGRGTSDQRRDNRDNSPSTRMRRQSSSESSYTRQCRDRNRRQGSRSSFDSRDSGSHSHDPSYSRHRSSSRPEHRNFNKNNGYDRGHNRQGQGRPPPRPYVKDLSNSESRWSGDGTFNRPTASSPGNHQQTAPGQHFGVFQPQQSPPFIPQPPMQGQSPGQFLPPPPPSFQPGAFPGGVPPPPPPNYSGPFPPPPPPNMAALPNNQYTFGNNQHGSAYTGNAGSGRNGGFNPNRGGFRGGRGGYRGNFSGGGNGNRGGYGGSQRGQRGGRW